MSLGPLPESRNSRFARGAGVLGVYAVLGPVLGGLILFSIAAALLTLFGMGPKQDSQNSFVLNLYELFTFALAAGYAFGGIQSVLTGAYLGFKTIRTGGFTRQMAMLAAVIASLVYIALIYLPTGLLGDNPSTISSGTWITLYLLPIAIACALLCRSVCRRVGLISDIS